MGLVRIECRSYDRRLGCKFSVAGVERSFQLPTLIRPEVPPRCGGVWRMVPDAPPNFVQIQGNAPLPYRVRNSQGRERGTRNSP